jgi:hypothetical protein
VVRLHDALFALAQSPAVAGASGEARQAYEIAIGLERDAAVRRFLQKQQSALDQSMLDRSALDQL